MSIDQPYSFAVKDAKYKYQNKPQPRAAVPTLEQFMSKKEEKPKRKKYTEIEVRKKTGMWSYETKKV